MIKVPIYLKLRKTVNGDTATVIHAAHFKMDITQDREAVIHFNLEIDPSIFDPTVDTGVTIKILPKTEKIDSKLVVEGLKKLESEVDKMQ